MKPVKIYNGLLVCLSVASVGAFGLVVKVHGSPQVGAGSRSMASSSTSRLVSGPSKPINEAIAAGPSAVITLQPVPPETVPASSYPPGSTIVDQTLSLATVPARIWIDVLVTGWAPETLGTSQVTISATDADMDGGGFSGSASDCAGNPTPGAGDLAPAMIPCPMAGGNDFCRAALTDLPTACAGFIPARCTNWTGVTPGGYFPAGRFCEPGFVNACDPEFVGTGFAQISIVDLSTYDFRFGFTLTEEEVEPEDFEPSFFGTFVIDAPANAKGTYTIDIDESETFLKNPGFPPGNDIPIAVFNPATIEIPCALLPDPSGVLKTRFISFLVPGDFSAVGAFRVSLISLHHVDPPYTGGPSVPFTAFEVGPDCAEAGGCIRWVGPPVQYLESSAIGAASFYSSRLQCSPHYQDWSTVGLLHVTGSAITPSSVYEVQFVDDSCMGDEESCTAVSVPLSIPTTRWGDVEVPYNPPDATVQPNISDCTAMVLKFRSVVGAPIKARVLIAGDDGFGNFSETTMTNDFDFGHIAEVVGAFRGEPYPHTIEECP